MRKAAGKYQNINEIREKTVDIVFKGRSLVQKIFSYTTLQRQNGQTFREYLNNNILNSIAGDMLEGSQIILSFILFIMFIMINWQDASGVGEQNWMSGLEIFLCLCFTVDYSLRFYSASNRYRYFFSFFPIIDVVIILRLYLLWINVIINGGNPEDLSQISKLSGFPFLLATLYSWTQFLRPLRCLRALRIVRASRLLRFVIKSPLYRQMLTVLLTMVTLLLCIAGIIQHMEYCDPSNTIQRCNINGITAKLTYIDAVYFCFVTISTVGYGDITPQTQEGKAMVILLIFVAIVLVPVEIGKLATLISQVSPYHGEFPLQPNRKHIVLCGIIDLTSLTSFFLEFYHPLQLNWNCKIVILAARQPSEDMVRFVKLNEMNGRLTYINGSPLSDDGLRRARVDQAIAVFVLCPSDTTNSKFDGVSTFIINSIRHFRVDVPIYSNCVSSENVNHLVLNGATDVLCTNQIKFNLMAMNCLYPGFSTFINNLVTSVNEEIFDISNEHWFQEYAQGSRVQVCKLFVPRHLSNTQFHGLAQLLYKKYSVILFAIVDPTTRHLIASEQNIVFSPSKFRLVEGDEIFFLSSDFFAPSLIEANAEQLMKEYLHINEGFTAPRRNSFVENIVENISANILSKNEGSSISPPPTDIEIMPIHKRAGSLLSIHTSEDDTKSVIFNNNSNTINSAKSKKRNILIEKNKSAFHLHSGVEIPYDEFISRPPPSILSNHIVLYGMPDEPLEFIAPLRTLNIPICPVVVIVTPAPITLSQYHQISRFKEIYCISGNMLSFKTCQTASVNTATSICILVNPSQADAELVDELMIDADAITVLKVVNEFVKHAEQLVVENMFTQPRKEKQFLCIELMHASNLKFVDLFEEAHRRSQNSPLEGGRKSSSSRRNSISSIKNFFTADTLGPILHPAIVSGSAFMSSMCERMLASSIKNESILNITKMLISSKTIEAYTFEKSTDSSSSSLISIQNSTVSEFFSSPVPPSFVNKSFLSLFEALLSVQVVCLGIYRNKDANNAPSDYVYTKPNAESTLHESDLIYLVGKRTQFLAEKI